MMLNGTGHLVQLLRAGKPIHKCRLDGQCVAVSGGTVALGEGGLQGCGSQEWPALLVTCIFLEDGQERVLQAAHALFDAQSGVAHRGEGENVIYLDGVRQDGADIEAQLVEQLFSIDLKAALDFGTGGTTHHIEVYARLVNALA